VEPGQRSQDPAADHSVAGLNAWRSVSSEHQVVGHVSAVGGQVNGRPAHREELTQSVMAIRELLAERSQAECETCFRNYDRPTRILAEPAAAEQGGLAESPALQAGVGRLLE